MAWIIEYSETAKKLLKKLDKATAKKILDYIDQRVLNSENPRNSGKALTGPLSNLWRYRVGDYRIICDIQDKHLRILVLTLGNRKDVYRH